MNEKQIKEEVLNFQVPEEFVSEFSDEEVETFNFKLFEALIDKIVLNLSEDLDEKNKTEFLELMEKEKTEPQEVIDFLIKNIENSVEKIGGIVFEHKKAVKEFIENN
jgi:hypothetical protein